MLALPGNFTNITCMRNGHGDSGDPWHVASSIGIFGGAVLGSRRKRGTRGWGKEYKVRMVLPIKLIQLSRDTRDGGSTGVYGMTVANVRDIVYSGREAGHQNDP